MKSNSRDGKAFFGQRRPFRASDDVVPQCFTHTPLRADAKFGRGINGTAPT